MAIYDIHGNVISAGGGSFVEDVAEVSEISSQSIKYKNAIVSATSGTEYGKGFRYAGNIISINVEAGKTYMLMGLHDNLTASMNTTFSKGLNPVGDEPMAVNLNADGTLGDANTNFIPEYLSISAVAPYGSDEFAVVTGKAIYWNGEYNAFSQKTASSLKETVDGTEYAWCALIFTANIDFCGIVQWGGFNLANDAFFRIFEIDPKTEYNPYLEGVLDIGAKKSNPVINETVMQNSTKAINENLLTKYNVLYGRKWYAAGDSLTQYAGGNCVPDDETDTGFITQIMRRTGVIGTNGGKAGLKWSSGTDGTFETGSAVDRVNTIINGTEMYDIVTFAYGTNSDVDGEGTIDDEPAYDGTMCAAIKWCIESLVAWNPDIQIGIILPPKRADMGASGNELMRTRGQLIKQVAELYGVPTCDMWAESGINLMHYTNPSTGNEKYYYLSDMLHLSDRGKIKYANRLKSFVESIANVYA